MPILDLTEVPSPSGGIEGFDAFEAFAREFLEFLGFETVSHPSRGPDGGKDLIVRELRRGAGGTSEVRWLVSCKHFAHSGRAVGSADEENVLDRVRAAGCTGFLSVYSTVPSSTLGTRLESLRAECEILWFDPEAIERRLLESRAGLDVAERFFPTSALAYRRENPAPIELFADQETLTCEYCGVDLLDPPSGIVTVWSALPDPDQDDSGRRFLDIYWCCKGTCDQALGAKYRAKHAGVRAVDGWEDIPDLCIPQLYLRWLLTTVNSLHAGDQHTDEALEKERRFVLHLAPLVFRDLTRREWDTLERLGRQPSWLGGLA